MFYARKTDVLPLYDNHLALLVFPYFITHTFLCYTISYHLFVSIELWCSTFYFQKDYFTQISLRESIKNQIINPFSQKHQIFVRIRKIWQQRSYFFMDISKYYIARSTYCITSLLFDFDHKIQFCKQIAHNQSYNDSENNQPKIGIHK